MPEDPKDRGRGEYSKNNPRQKTPSVGTEEELGDMHYSTENYSVALEYYEKSLKKINAKTPASHDLARIYRKISDCYH